MVFADLASGESVFLDANSFIYHFTSHALFGPACRDLLRRIDQKDLLGFTSTHILSEVSHRMMIIEAANLPGWGREQHTPTSSAAAANDRQPGCVPECRPNDHFLEGGRADSRTADRAGCDDGE
jgi:hypothetical protein